MRNRSGGAAKLIGYRAPDYEPKDTDVIALFRVTPQEGVDYRLSAEAETVFMDYIRRRMKLAHFANAARSATHPTGRGCARPIGSFLPVARRSRASRA